MFCVHKKSRTPLYIQITSQIKAKILSGEFREGFLLPSERSLARQTGVHRNTVTRAYAELKEEGFVQPVAGIGMKVTHAMPDKETSYSKKRKAVHWASLIKDEYFHLTKTFDDLFTRSYEEGIISFAGGMASPDIYEREEIIQNLREILSTGYDRPYFYTPYQGDHMLRAQLSDFLRGKGISAGLGEIQVLAETNQALDFIVSLFLKPGDKVLVEEYVSPDVYRPIKLAGGEVVKVSMDENGMICDMLEPLIERHMPKFIYVNSSFQDPTGTRLSLARRKKLLELSYRYRIPIIEEDSVSELIFEGEKLPSIRALDPGSNVIYIYSFSLTFVPGMNVAFLVAPREVVQQMSQLISIRLITLDWISQKLLCRYLEQGVYQERLKHISNEYQSKCKIMQSWLDSAESAGIKYKKACGGVYVWCHLPEHINVQRLSKEALREGVSFIPGEVFSHDGTGGENNIRLNYSYPNVEQIEKGMRILTDLWRG